MKSIEEIKNQIDYAIASKKIDGFIENDCLYIDSPRIYYVFIILLLSVPLFGIGILTFIAYLGFRLRYFYWIPPLYLLIVCIFCKLSKDYMVYDYNRGLIYFATKINKTTVWKGYYVDIRSILELGITYNYVPEELKKAKYKVPISSLFKKTEDKEIYEKACRPNLVYLNSEGKIKNFFAHYYFKDFEENLRNYYELMGNLLEIPTKICENSQKLQVSTETSPVRLEIVPINIKEEKLKDFTLHLQLWLAQIILHLFLSIEILFIYVYGFLGSFSAWGRMFYRFFTEFIPGLFGLR